MCLLKGHHMHPCFPVALERCTSGSCQFLGIAMLSALPHPDISLGFCGMASLFVLLLWRR